MAIEGWPENRPLEPGEEPTSVALLLEFSGWYGASGDSRKFTPGESYLSARIYEFQMRREMAEHLFHMRYAGPGRHATVTL